MQAYFLKPLLCISIAFCSTQLIAQYTQFATNPISLLYGVYKVEAEFPLGNHFAIEPEFSLLSQGQRFWFPDYNTKGHRIGAVVKKYFDKRVLNEGFYGFVYLRHASLAFTDFQAEGELPDQRDFSRRRNIFGFGAGYTKVGQDGFYYGCSFGIGRHTPQNDKKYTSTLPEGMISTAGDEGIFRTPIDVYARVSVGVRIYTEAGLKERQAYEQAIQDEQDRYDEWIIN